MSQDWHARTAQETAEHLESHLMDGLASEEARRRLSLFGPNELQEMPKPGLLHLLLNQLSQFLVLILIVAALISLLLGNGVEALAIMTIVVLNTILGVVQESRAEEALAALKKMAAPEARVIRDQKNVTIHARDLVPGDIVLLEAGNYVPADLRLVESVNLRIDESPLTGESVPVQKSASIVLDREIPLGDRENSAHMGTLVTYGRGRGIVFATGMKTQMGLIAEMIQSYEEEPTPLQKRLNQLGKWLGAAALVLCGFIFLIGLLRGIAPMEMFLVAVSLAIAAVPEGLPAVVTICLAVGMQRMVRKHALLRRLPVVETLGSATTICADKTGTMTQNQMTVVKAFADNTLFEITEKGYTPFGQFLEDGQPVETKEHPTLRMLLTGALLCNDAYLETSGAAAPELRTYRLVGDPTEGALVVAAAKAGLWKSDLEAEQPRLDEIPFDSERKRMTTIHTDARRYIAYVKGAPDVLLALCRFAYLHGAEVPLTDEHRESILQINAQLSSQALRLLGVAYRHLGELPRKPTSENVERDLVFLGLLGMMDPPRAEVKEAIKTAKEAGIRSVMITGDHLHTAMAVAKELQLSGNGGQVITGEELDRMSQAEFLRQVQSIDVYARVSPQHKVRIVEALKKQGEIVAMTGDGINDAPALKRADIGVAMGITGTDVSKQTADMVLTDDNYASIVAAVEEGRIIYSNIRKFVFYLLSCNVAEIATIFLTMIAGLPLPLTAIQILVLNLITDGAPALALGLERGDPDIMERPPRPTSEPVINREMRAGIVVQTVAITFATITAFLIGLRQFPNNLSAAQTMAFATLSISELLRAYTSRSERHYTWEIGITSNQYMQWAVLSSLLILLGIIYLPFLDPVFDTAFLGAREWAAILPLLLVPAAAAEVFKFLLRRQPPSKERRASCSHRS